VHGEGDKLVGLPHRTHRPNDVLRKNGRNSSTALR
jgi:hypothetical protein